MSQKKTHVPQNVNELIELLNSMLLLAPKFLDKTGYLPFLNLDYIFRELDEGLNNNRRTLGEEFYSQLMQMSAHIRALFEADPDDNTGDTLKGCKIIHEMEDMLRDVPRKA